MKNILIGLALLSLSNITHASDKEVKFGGWVVSKLVNKYTDEPIQCSIRPTIENRKKPYYTWIGFNVYHNKKYAPDSKPYAIFVTADKQFLGIGVKYRVDKMPPVEIGDQVPRVGIRADILESLPELQHKPTKRYSVEGDAYVQMITALKKGNTVIYDVVPYDIDHAQVGGNNSLEGFLEAYAAAEKCDF